MDTNPQILFILDALCLLPILIFSAIAGYRSKSLRAGLIFFFKFAFPVTMLLLIANLYIQYLPEGVQITIGRVVFYSSYGFIFLYMILYRNFSIKAGELIPTGKSNTMQKASLFLAAYCLISMMSDLIFVGNVDESMRRNIFFWLLAIALNVQAYRSFELRQNGFVYRGKVILSSDVEHAEWGNLMDKTELCLRLKNTDKVIKIKTPWELITPIDNYIKSNFPRP